MDTDSTTALLATFEAQRSLNDSVETALRSILLTEDRRDAELAEIRAEIAALANRIEGVTIALRLVTTPQLIEPVPTT